MNKVFDLSKKLYCPYRSISTRILLFKEHKRKVKETVELVTLVDENDKILGLKPKTESEKLARKLNLLLERVYDPKYGKTHPAYKMLSSADLLKAEKKVSAAKVLRKLPINHSIADHDLMTKIKVVKKWLSKSCEVHVHILGKSEEQSRMKAVFSKIEEEMKAEFRILNVRHKEDGIKLILLPEKQPKSPGKENVEKDTDNL